MTLKNRVKELCASRNISMNQLEQDLSFGKGYISKLGSSSPNTAKLQKIADYFDVTLDYLLKGEDKDGLNDRDRKDITKDLNNIMAKLTSGEDGPASYNGKEIPDEDREMFAAQLEIMLRRLKIINKEKYNPNKNKK